MLGKLLRCVLYQIYQKSTPLAPWLGILQVLTLASGITTYKYGIGERQLFLLGITTAENSASFYIAHIVHYSPIYLPAARTDERQSIMVPGGNGNLRNW